MDFPIFKKSSIDRNCWIL